MKITSLVLLLAFSFVRGMVAAPDEPKLTVKWVSAPDLKQISVSITNNGGKPVEVDATTKMFFMPPDRKFDLKKMIERNKTYYSSDFVPGKIYFLAEFIPVSRDSRTGELVNDEGGLPTVPCTISPGETKVIKFSLPEPYIKEAEKCREGTFAVATVGQVFKEFQVENQGGAWK